MNGLQEIKHHQQSESNMNTLQGISPQWTPNRAPQPLVGPKQGADLLHRLANSYKRQQPPRRGLRGGQSHPNKHYSGLVWSTGLAKEQYFTKGPPGPAPDPVLWFPGGDAECGVAEGGFVRLKLKAFLLHISKIWDQRHFPQPAAA